MFQVENYQKKIKEEKTQHTDKPTNERKPIYMVDIYRNNKASSWTLFPVKLLESILNGRLNPWVHIEIRTSSHENQVRKVR